MTFMLTKASACFVLWLSDSIQCEHVKLYQRSSKLVATINLRQSITLET